MTLSRTMLAAATLVGPLVLTACGHSSYSYINISHGDVVLENHGVVIHADGAPDAIVTPSGELHIGSRTVTVNASQRQLLHTYYLGAEQITQHSIAVGKAGAGIAGSSLWDGLRNLFGHHRDDTGVKKRTEYLLTQVSLICDDLQSMQNAQNAIAAQLDAFRPYTRLKDSDVQSCRQDIAKERSKLSTSND